MPIRLDGCPPYDASIPFFHAPSDTGYDSIALDGLRRQGTMPQGVQDGVGDASPGSPAVPPMLRLTRVQFRQAENLSPVDGTRCARFGRLVSRLVDVAAICFVSARFGQPREAF